MSADKQGGFVQFPLCLLASDWPMPELMDRAFAYSAFKLAYASDEYQELDFDGDWNWAQQRVEALYHDALAKVGVGFKSYAHAKTLYDEASGFLVEFKNAYGEGPFVRMPTDYAEQIAEKSWHEREARIYMAIASAIGRKPYSRVTWQTIALRVGGYVKSPQKEFRWQRRAMRQYTLTRDQIEYELRKDRLTSLFARYTYNKRVRYFAYPATTSREQIVRYVIQKKIRQKQESRDSDAALTAKVTAELTKQKP